MYFNKIIKKLHDKLNYCNMMNEFFYKKKLLKKYIF